MEDFSIEEFKPNDPDVINLPHSIFKALGAQPDVISPTPEGGWFLGSVLVIEKCIWTNDKGTYVEYSYLSGDDKHFNRLGVRERREALPLPAEVIDMYLADIH